MHACMRSCNYFNKLNVMKQQQADKDYCEQYYFTWSYVVDWTSYALDKASSAFFFIAASSLFILEFSLRSWAFALVARWYFFRNSAKDFFKASCSVAAFFISSFAFSILSLYSCTSSHAAFPMSDGSAKTAWASFFSFSVGFLRNRYRKREG